MTLCNGCKNAGEIISLEAALKDANERVGTLLNEARLHREELQRTFEDAGRARTALLEANRTIKRLQVELDTAKEDKHHGTDQ